MSGLALRISVALLALTPAVATAQKRCVKGIPCGNTCIAANKTCRVGSGGGTSARTPAVDPAPVSIPEGAQFVASSRGQVYYWVGCSSWKSLSPSNMRFFSTRAEAVRAGYRPSQSAACAGPEDPPPTSAGQLDGAAPLTAVSLSNGPTARPAPSSAAASTGTVTSCALERVIDGDTFVCADGRTVRMLLIDAPEGVPYGPVSKAELERMLTDVVTVSLEPDVEEQDRYGRVLAYVYLPSGLMLNEELLRTGMAKVAVYPPNVRDVKRFDAIADSARQAKRGLWATSAFECAPADPKVGRCR